MPTFPHPCHRLSLDHPNGPARCGDLNWLGFVAGLWSRFRRGTVRRRHFCAILLLGVALGGCSEIARTDADPPQAEPPAASLAAEYMRSNFKDRSTLEGFEISQPRWVHSLVGWSWLACVRFRDQGRERSYTLFIQNNAIVDSRYSVETDACAAQTYSPFDVDSGTLGRPTPPRQPALY
jgi:hypothetical protein